MKHFTHSYDSSLDKRNPFRDEIIKLALKNKGLVYGGVLRDICRKWFDIDVGFSKVECFDDFVEELHHHFNVELIGETQAEHSHYAHKSFRLSPDTCPEVIIMIDVNYCVCGELIELDFDVNGLVQNCPHILTFRCGECDPRQSDLNLFTLLEQINRQEFNIVANIKKLDKKQLLLLANRVCKMLNRGWTCLNLAGEIAKLISIRYDHECPHHGSISSYSMIDLNSLKQDNQTVSLSSIPINAMQCTVCHFVFAVKKRQFLVQCEPEKFEVSSDSDSCYSNWSDD